MLNKSNSESLTSNACSKDQTNSSDLLGSQKKTSKPKKSKLNSILNRTLSDSVLNKKTSTSNTWNYAKVNLNIILNSIL